MKLMIDISDSTYEAIMARDWKNAGWLFSEEMKAIHDGTPIPGGATNGDMIKALFPNLGINSPLKCNDTNWWNAPYKGEQEPCEDAISRSNMLDAIGHGTTYTSEELQKIIKGLPPVNPQPKIGHWFAWKPEGDVWRTTCSECGEETRTLWDYCPYCGAKMVEPQERSEKK